MLDRRGEVSAMAEEQRFKRLYPRRQYHAPCRVNCVGRLITGKVVDVSYNGVGIVLPQAVELTEVASVELPDRIRLRVHPVYNEPVDAREEWAQYRVGYKIQLIEQGQRIWTNLCHVVHW
jgi:hypothetical protein